MYIFDVFEFTCIYFLPCLFENQWNIGNDKTYKKMERKFFGRKDEWCTHQRRIQNPAKRFIWKKLFVEIGNGWKSWTIFAKNFIFDVWQGSQYASGNYTDSLNQLFLNVIYHFDSNRPYRDFRNSCIDARAWGCNQNAFFIYVFLSG